MIQKDKLKIIKIAKEAGQEILKIYNKDILISYKEDLSPVTNADLISNDIICEGLKKIKNIPIVSEENKNDINQIDLESFWMIDPLDGTKDFIEKNNEFTINIALIKDDQPIFGIIYAPALNEIYIAQKGSGAFFMKDDTFIKILPKKKLNNNLVTSRQHSCSQIDLFAKNFNINKISYMGSSLKFAKVAMGEFGIYLRYVGSNEWDIASGCLIISEMGGVVLDLFTKNEITFNKKTFTNTGFFTFNTKKLINHFDFNLF